MRLTLTTAPETNAVDLESAASHGIVDHNDDDALIASFIVAATQYLDGPHGILGRAVMPQVWLLELTAWQEAVVLPVEPVRSVVVTYIDVPGDEQTLDPASYQLSAWPSQPVEWRFASGAVRPALGDVAYPVRITINAGYADADSVPEPIKIAIKMLAAHWYEHREAVTSGSLSEVPMAFSALIAPYRRQVG